MTTGQKQEDECRFTFEAWASEEWKDKNVPHNAWLGWQAGWNARAQQRPDLRAVREALELVKQGLNVPNLWGDFVIEGQIKLTVEEDAIQSLDEALALLTTPQAAQEDVVERGYVIRGLQYALAKWRSDCTPEGQAMQRHIAALQPITRDKEGV